MEPEVPPGRVSTTCPSSKVSRCPDVTERMMKVELGQGTEYLPGSAAPSGSWSSRESGVTVSGGVAAPLEMVEISSSFWGSSRLRAIAGALVAG